MFWNSHRFYLMEFLKRWLPWQLSVHLVCNDEMIALFLLHAVCNYCIITSTSLSIPSVLNESIYLSIYQRESVLPLCLTPNSISSWWRWGLIPILSCGSSACTLMVFMKAFSRPGHYSVLQIILKTLLQSSEKSHDVYQMMRASRMNNSHQKCRLFEENIRLGEIMGKPWPRA